jgi:hypothetical protein
LRKIKLYEKGLSTEEIIEILNIKDTLIKNIIEEYKSKKTAHNRTVTASPLYGGSGYEKPQSGCALCAVFLRHIWGRGRCCAMPYHLPQTSVTAGTLCASLPKTNVK